MKTYLTNARIVLVDAILNDASLLIEDGSIAAINPDFSNNVQTLDLAGKILMPGMMVVSQKLLKDKRFLSIPSS